MSIFKLLDALFSDPETREANERTERAYQRAADAAKKLDEANARLAAVKQRGVEIRREAREKELLDLAVQRLERAQNSSISSHTEKPPILDGHPLRYRYHCSFAPAEGAEAARAILQARCCTVDVETDENRILLSRDGIFLGELVYDRMARMIRDFKQAEEPVRAILSESGEEFELQFYRDMRRRNAWRAQTVTYLLGNMDPGVQDNIAYAEPGLELDLDEDNTPGHYVKVFACGRLIGCLPRDLSDRHQKDDAYLAVYEKTEPRQTPNGNELVAYVRLFW